MEISVASPERSRCITHISLCQPGPYNCHREEIIPPPVSINSLPNCLISLPSPGTRILWSRRGPSWNTPSYISSLFSHSIYFWDGDTVQVFFTVFVHFIIEWPFIKDAPSTLLHPLNQSGKNLVSVWSPLSFNPCGPVCGQFFCFFLGLFALAESSVIRHMFTWLIFHSLFCKCDL